jgi:hypothetical protein
MTVSGHGPAPFAWPRAPSLGHGTSTSGLVRCGAPTRLRVRSATPIQPQVTVKTRFLRTGSSVNVGIPKMV